MTDDEWRAAAQMRGLPIANLAALRQALTHKSLVPNTPLQSNERLEFVGDSVLGLVIVEYLYATFPDKGEGDLAQAKALIVCQATLAAAARRLQLTPLLRLGRAEESLGGRSRPSLIADAFEALIAVIYQENGLDAARQFVLTTLAPTLAEVGGLDDFRDAKTVLQERRMAEKRSPPVYALKSETGRPHDKTFVMNVVLDGEIVGTGTGKSKKEAEQAAATDALEK